MVCLTEEWLRSCVGVGARIRRSKLNNSHHRMSVSLVSVVWTMLDISVLSRKLNRFLLFPVRNRLQFDRKFGGSCW